jgi:hypothetical protein
VGYPEQVRIRKSNATNHCHAYELFRSAIVRSLWIEAMPINFTLLKTEVWLLQADDDSIELLHPA